MSECQEFIKDDENYAIVPDKHIECWKKGGEGGLYFNDNLILEIKDLIICYDIDEKSEKNVVLICCCKFEYDIETEINKAKSRIKYFEEFDIDNILKMCKVICKIKKDEKIIDFNVIIEDLYGKIDDNFLLFGLDINH